MTMVEADEIIIEAERKSAALTAVDVSTWFGTHKVLERVSLEMRPNEVTALIGPSGCGKSTFLRTLNRMHELVPGAALSGTITLDGTDIYRSTVPVSEIRRRIGMVFQKPNPFPKSIYENIAYGPRIHGLVANRADLDEVVQRSLQKAGLWEEVKDRLDHPGTGLSGGQQQRLCIARSLAIEPEVLLMDEPASALDPTATARIEELVLDLKDRYTIVIVTHNMQQAARISDRTAFMMQGELVEVDETRRMFTSPRQKLTEDYITGRFG